MRFVNNIITVVNIILERFPWLRMVALCLIVAMLASGATVGVIKLAEAGGDIGVGDAIAGFFENLFDGHSESGERPNVPNSGPNAEVGIVGEPYIEGIYDEYEDDGVINVRACSSELGSFDVLVNLSNNTCIYLEAGDNWYPMGNGALCIERLDDTGYGNNYEYLIYKDGEHMTTVPSSVITKVIGAGDGYLLAAGDENRYYFVSYDGTVEVTGSIESRWHENCYYDTEWRYEDGWFVGTKSYIEYWYNIDTNVAVGISRSGYNTDPLCIGGEIYGVANDWTSLDNYNADCGVSVYGGYHIDEYGNFDDTWDDDYYAVDAAENCLIIHETGYDTVLIFEGGNVEYLGNGMFYDLYYECGVNILYTEDEKGVYCTLVNSYGFSIWEPGEKYSDSEIDIVDATDDYALICVVSGKGVGEYFCIDLSSGDVVWEYEEICAPEIKGYCIMYMSTYDKCVEVFNFDCGDVVASLNMGYDSFELADGMCIIAQKGSNLAVLDGISGSDLTDKLFDLIFESV